MWCGVKCAFGAALLVAALGRWPEGRGDGWVPWRGWQGSRQAGGSQELRSPPELIPQFCLPLRLRQKGFSPVTQLIVQWKGQLVGQEGPGCFVCPQGCLSLGEGTGRGPAFAGSRCASTGAILGQAEVSGQGAEFGLLGFPVDVDPPDGVPFLDVVHVLQEVQVQVEAVRCLHRVGEAAGLLPLPVGFGWLAVC